MSQIRVTPAPGRVVPDPDRRDTLPAAGRSVPHTAYWQRRIKDGDVLVGVAPKKPAKGAK